MNSRKRLFIDPFAVVMINGSPQVLIHKELFAVLYVVMVSVVAFCSSMLLGSIVWASNNTSLLALHRGWIFAFPVSPLVAMSFIFMLIFDVVIVVLIMSLIARSRFSWEALSRPISSLSRASYAWVEGMSLKGMGILLAAAYMFGSIGLEMAFVR
ncbi:MAG: hypothetical protein ACXVBE_08615 [Bdellovibrionota bacterium]